MNFFFLKQYVSLLSLEFRFRSIHIPLRPYPVPIVGRSTFAPLNFTKFALEFVMSTIDFTKSTYE